MFGFFTKRLAESTADGRARGEPVISTLLLGGDSFPVEGFLKQIARAKLAGRSATNIQPGDGGVFSFDVGDEHFAVALMPGRYPASDLDGPLTTAWLWPPTPPIETVKQHRSFLLITMMGGAGDPVRRRLILTAVTALAARQPGVMAVYWGEATQVIFPDVFVSLAESTNSPTEPPLYLWVDLRAFGNADGTTGLFTTGLQPLGHMEIEIPQIDMEPGDLREWLLSIMYYLLEKGPVLRHGETIGMTAEQRIRIRHCPSSFGHPGNVIRLEP